MCVARLKLFVSPLSLLLLMALNAPVVAQSLIIDASSGERLQLQHLPSGKSWASFRLSDRNLDSFASSELILLQVDNHYPISIVEGLRSCAAAVRPPQQVFYQFVPDAVAEQGQLTVTTASGSLADRLIQTARPVADYPTLTADRRPEWFDFQLTGQNTAELLLQQLLSGQQLSLRYSTADGQSRLVRFELPPAAVQDWFAAGHQR